MTRETTRIKVREEHLPAFREIAASIKRLSKRREEAEARAAKLNILEDAAVEALREVVEDTYVETQDCDGIRIDLDEGVIVLLDEPKGSQPDWAKEMLKEMEGSDHA